MGLDINPFVRKEERCQDQMFAFIRNFHHSVGATYELHRQHEACLNFRIALCIILVNHLRFGEDCLLMSENHP